MARAVLELVAATEGWNGGLKKAETGLMNFIKKQGGLHEALAKNDQDIIRVIQKMGNMESKATTASGRVRDMEKAFMTLSGVYSQLTAKEEAAPIGRATIKSLEQLKTRVLEAKRELKGLQSELALPSEKAVSIGPGFGAQFGKTLMNGIVPGLGMGLGVASAMKAMQALGAMKEQVIETVRTNMEFEQSNANLAAILGKTTDQVGKLTENAKKLGGETKFTASEITELQTVLARRGLGQDQILAMTHGISNLAVATGTDLAQSAELAASTMQAFGMKATEMDRIVSVLGVSTTKSALTTEALGTSLQYVAPAARAAGFSLEDTVAILGTLVNNGINASTAGTSLRQILLSMGTESGKLAKALGGPIKSFDELVAALQRLKNDGGNSLEAVSKAVRVTALPAFLALVNSADGLDELRGSITGVDAELQKMADTQLNTAKGAKIIFQSAVEGLKLTFEESNGVMMTYYQTLTKIVNKWKEARNLNNGSDAAISVYRRDLSAQEKKDVELAVNGYRAGGVKDEDIPGMFANQRAETAQMVKDLRQAYDLRVALNEDLSRAKWNKQFDALGRQNAEAIIQGIYSKYGIDQGATNTAWKSILPKAVADAEHALAKYDYVNQYLSDKGVTTPTGVAGDETSGSDLLEELKKQNKKKTPAEIAADKVADALGAYESAINLATEEFKQDAIDSKSFLSKKQSAQERVYKAYYEAYELTGNEEYKKAMQEWIAKVVETASSQSELNNALKALADKWKKEAANNEALVAADNSLYGQIKSAVGRTAWDRIAQSGGDISSRFAAMKVQLSQGVEIPDDVWTQFVQDLNEKLAELKLAPIQLNLDTNSVTTMKNEAKETAQVWSLAAQSVSNIGSALQQIEDPSAKIAGIVATAIASTALGFAQASASHATGALGIFGWIAASTAGLANMAAMIASIKSVTAEYHAEGGMVGYGPFQSRGTDTVPAMLTPGELVLNRAQQTNLAGQLAGSANRPYNIVVTGKISGRDIRLAADTDNRSRGGSRGAYAKVR